MRGRKIRKTVIEIPAIFPPFIFVARSVPDAELMESSALRPIFS